MTSRRAQFYLLATGYAITALLTASYDRAFHTSEMLSNLFMGLAWPVYWLSKWMAY